MEIVFEEAKEKDKGNGDGIKNNGQSKTTIRSWEDLADLPVAEVPKIRETSLGWNLNGPPKR